MTIEPTPAKGIGVPSAVIRGMEDKGDTEVKDEESGDICGKYQNPRPIQSVTYLRNYEATNLWKKRTLFVAARRETSEIAQPKY